MKTKELLFGDVSSEAKTLAVSDWQGLVRVLGLGIAAVVINYLIEIVPGIDFGQANAVITPVIMLGLDLLRRYVGSKQQ